MAMHITRVDMYTFIMYRHTPVCTYVCRHICVGMSMHTFVGMHIHIFICGHIHVYEYTHTFVCGYVHICVWAYTHAYEHTHVFVWLCACVYLCVPYTYVYLYVVSMFSSDSKILYSFQIFR